MMTHTNLPNIDLLYEHLSLLLIHHGVSDPLVKIERKTNPFSSTFPSEVVCCSFKDGVERKLLLKYSLEKMNAGHGYWRNVSYEAKVYQKVLSRLPVTVPRFFGTFVYNAIGQECLVLEYIEGSLRLNKSPKKALLLAAEWLGRFHAAAETWQLSYDPPSFLMVHDADYYAGWARRALLFAKQTGLEYPWFERVCEYFVSHIPILMNGMINTVHGEFYPKNVLFSDGMIYALDWQSAAIARGEIDLASLLEGWRRKHKDLVKECEERYQMTRWPTARPDDFHQAFLMARLYWPLRWLGERREWITHRNLYFRYLQREAEYAALL